MCALQRWPSNARAARTGRLALAASALVPWGCVYSFDPPTGYCSPDYECPQGEYCSYADLQCGDDVLGRCVPMPVGQCTPPPGPVCACDGKLYENSCMPPLRGVDLAAGRCALDPGLFSCGFRICSSVETYCLVISGVPAAQPEFECRADCGGAPTCECAMATPKPFPHCTCSEQAGAVVVQCMP